MKYRQPNQLRCGFRLFLLIGMMVLFSPTVVFADETAAMRHFEVANQNEPMLIAFLKGMPKGADLHSHVSGAIYAESMMDYAVTTNLFFDTATGAFVSSPNERTTIPASQLKSNPILMRKFFDAVSMRGAYPAITSDHDHFFDSFGIFGSVVSRMDYDQVLAEVVSRAKLQNVQYLELMGSVTPRDAMNVALSNPPSLDNWNDALASMQQRFPALLYASKEFLDQRDHNVADRLNIPAPITSSDNPVHIKYIYSLSRTTPLPQFFASVACGMAIMQNDPRVVALNIVAPEDDYNSRQNFEEQMKIIDFLWQRMGHPNITLHAGELTLEYSPMEVLTSRIRKSIEIGHANRIGHGVSIAWENNLQQLLAKMKREGIAVEICLTSNDGILKIAGDRHPFPLYQKAGVPLTLNTDDEGVNRSNLTMEYVKAARTFHLSYTDLKNISRNGIEYSFLPGISLYINRNYSKLHPEFIGVRAIDWQPSANAKLLMKQSEKLTSQVQLERAFVKFEQDYN